jgi:hypothetical protein
MVRSAPRQVGCQDAAARRGEQLPVCGRGRRRWTRQ